MFLEFSEFVAVALVVLFIIFQIIIPGYKGTPLFPMFNSGKRRLQKQLSEAKENVEDARIKKDIKKEVEKAKKT